jgi:predicted nucleic acid-binding protein
VSAAAKTRVVFDTNAVLSALLFANGRLKHFPNTRAVAKSVQGGFFLGKKPLGGINSLGTNSENAQGWLVGHWEAGNCVPLVSRAAAAELTRVLAYPKFCLSADEQLEILGGYLPFWNADLLVTGDRDLLALVGQTEFLIETPEAYQSGISGSERKS